MMTNDTQGDIWEVFIQQKTGQPHKHAGSVHATDKEMALQNARDTYTRRKEGTSIWVVLTENIQHLIPMKMSRFLTLPMTKFIDKHLITLSLKMPNKFDDGIKRRTL